MSKHTLEDRVSGFGDLVSAFFLYGVLFAILGFFGLLFLADLSMSQILYGAGGLGVLSAAAGALWRPARRFAGIVVGFILTALAG